MNKFIRLFGFTVVLTMVIGLLAACANTENLDTPKNVQISVEERTMTVTWDAVKNARGYEIYTTSTGCGSGNKIINTKDKTATNHEGEGSYIKSDKSNGAVEIKGKTKIEITLMPMGEDNTKPMASEVSAKVKALGGKEGGNEYLNSGYSSTATKPLSGGMGM